MIFEGFKIFCDVKHRKNTQKRNTKKTLFLGEIVFFECCFNVFLVLFYFL